MNPFRRCEYVAWRDGMFCVVVQTPDAQDPKVIRTWWAIEPATLARTSEFADAAVVQHSAAEFEIMTREFCPMSRTTYVAVLTVRIAGGADATPLAVEEIPVPAPRTQLTTRWRSGRWEKRTGRGWVGA